MRTLGQVTRNLNAALRRKGQTREDAEDIVQEAMLKFEIYRRQRDVANPEAFIARTARNIAVDIARRSRSSPLVEERPEHWHVLDPAPDQLDALLARRELDRLKAGLATLDRTTRAVLLAHRLDGVGYAEIARREGVSQTAIVKRVARGMLFLHRWMAE